MEMIIKESKVDEIVDILYMMLDEALRNIEAIENKPVFVIDGNIAIKRHNIICQPIVFYEVNSSGYYGYSDSSVVSPLPTSHVIYV